MEQINLFFTLCLFLTHLLLNPYKKLSTKYIRSILVNGGQLQKIGNIFEMHSYAGVGQDKAPQVRYTADSFQPYTADRGAVDKPKQHGSEKRQTAHVSARIPHDVKTLLLEIAEANGWTESKAVSEACKAFIEQDLGEKFGQRLAAKVTDALEKGLRIHSNREAYFSRHGYYAAEESRIITTRVLRYLFGEETEVYKQIVVQAREDAYINICRPVEEKKQTRF